jgi:hypothetical protein
MSETWQGLFMDLVVNLLGFSTPTHTHNFDSHSNSYDRSKTADVRSSVDCRKSGSSTGSKLGNSFETWRGLRFLILPYFLIDQVARLYAHMT